MPGTFLRLLTPACAVALVACGGGGGGGGGGSAPTTAPAPAPIGASSVQEILQDGVNGGADGVILTVLESDGSRQSWVAGRRERVPGAAMREDDIFKMASVSKLYIAVAVVQLVDQGVLSLDDTIAQHLPDIGARIENGNRINLELLLKHRSGIPDFDSQAGFSWRASHTDLERVLGYALDLPADFSPNERYEYSNTNYLLLGLIMDKVLGYSHHQHIQNFIFDPLELRETFHALSEVEPARLVHGYWDGRETTTSDYVIPGGSMLATASDIATFVDALARGKIFDAEAQAIYEDVYWLQHSGWLPGYQTRASYNAGLNASVVLHINTTGGDSERIVDDVLDRVLQFLRR